MDAAANSPSTDVASAEETLSLVGLEETAGHQGNALTDSDQETVSGAALGEACEMPKLGEDKILDSQQLEEDFAEISMEPDQDSAARALGDDVILQKIFKNLPTGLLLSSCSLVNKFWNAEARSFIWTYRKCTPREGWSKTTCQFLRDVDELCSQIIANGRKIPFNRLRLLYYSHDPVNCSEDLSEGEITGHVGKKLKIKYLEALPLWQKFECKVHQPLGNLLSKDGRSQLRSFQIDNVLPLGEILSRSGWNHQFTQLQWFSLGDQIDHLRKDDISVSKEIVAQLLNLAPNLKEIYAPNVAMLEIVPEEKYKFLRKLKFRLKRNEDIQLVNKIAQHSSGVEDLEIYEPPTASQVEKREHLVNDEPVNANLRRQFEHSLDLLVQTCQKSVRSISVGGAYSLGQIAQAPLLNLKRFKVEKFYAGTASTLWNALSSTDYARIAPNLQEMEIMIDTVVWSAEDFSFEVGDDTYIDWPENGDNNLVSICSSVRELTLDLQVRKVNLNLIANLLPNVSELVIRINHTWTTYNDLPPVWKIWELWPCLEKLVITGQDNYLQRNFDADFCGISKEEAELLREKDDDFLKAVHIVPIRPCLTTMIDLHTMRIDLKFTEAMPENSVRYVDFVTKVTEFVALRRLSAQNMRISWAVRR